MKGYAKQLALLLLVCLTGCAARSGEVRVTGDEEALSGFVMPVKEIFEEENSGETIAIVRSNPGAGLAELLDGEVDAIVSVHPLAELVRAAATQKIKVDSAELQSTTVGKSDLVVFLNAKNNVKKITRKQLQAIFSGRLTNWKQLHGANREIFVIWDASAATENELFVKKVLGGAPVTANLLAVENFEAVRKQVMETPGAIGVAPAGMTLAGLKVPKAPKTSSNVIIVTKGEPSAGVRKLTGILLDMETM